MEEQQVWVIVGVSITVFIIVVAFLVICVVLGYSYKYLKRRKYEEDGSEEGNILAIGGGNSSGDVLTAKNEVKEKKSTKKKIDWADQDSINDLVNSLPRKLPISRNTCLNKETKEVFSCAIDTTNSVVEAILLNQGGKEFADCANSKAKELIEGVKASLSWRLQHEFKVSSTQREPIWNILLEQFPECFKPRGKKDASVKGVMNALAQIKPLEVIFTATCLNPDCRCVIGNFRYTFDEVPCAFRVGIVRGRTPNLAEKLPEIVQNSLRQISRPAAEKIRCFKCPFKGASVSQIKTSDLKIPNVLIVEFATKQGGDQETLPLQLDEVINFDGHDDSYKLVAAVMHKPEHFFTISNIGESYFNFDDLRPEGRLATPFPNFLSAFMLGNQDHGRKYKLNNERETRGNAVLYVVYMSKEDFVGEEFDKNLASTSEQIIEDNFGASNLQIIANSGQDDQNYLNSDIEEVSFEDEKALSRKLTPKKKCWKGTRWS